MSKFASSRFGVVVAVVVAAVTVGVTNAEAATSYSGHARPLSVSAFGASVSIGDTGALPASGGSQSASLTNLNVLGLQVTTQPISIDVSGDSTGTNVLGNLICTILTTVNNVVGLVNLLNQLLGLLGGLTG